MPPKKKSKTTAAGASKSKPAAPPAAAAAAAPTSTRTSRAKTRAAATTAVETSPKNGKRKRPEDAGGRVDVIDLVDDDEVMELESIPARTAPPARRAPAKAKAPARFAVKTCASWFAKYADPDTGDITGGTLGGWMEDIGVSTEGVAMYFLLWKCGAASTMTITKPEFMHTMTAWDVDTNEKLFAKLGKDDFMYSLRPRTGDDPDHPEFFTFYKWCFNHFRVENAKNITADVATVLFETLLDPEKYQPSYEPTEAAEVDEGCPRVRHVAAFIEFLRNGPKPAAVVTRDQYEQFYHFNKQIPWNLEGYSEETSTWPTLLDDYIVWKKERYPTEDKPAE